MIDVTTVAIGVAVSDAVGVSVDIYQQKKINKIQKDIKRQRAEMYTLEGSLIGAMLATFIESRILRRRLQKSHSDSMQRMDILEMEINDLAMQVRSLNISALDAKVDMIVSAVATPKIIPGDTPKEENKVVVQVVTSDDKKDKDNKDKEVKEEESGA